MSHAHQMNEHPSEMSHKRKKFQLFIMLLALLIVAIPAVYWLLPSDLPSDFELDEATQMYHICIRRPLNDRDNRLLVRHVSRIGVLEIYNQDVTHLSEVFKKLANCEQLELRGCRLPTTFGETLPGLVSLELLTIPSLNDSIEQSIPKLPRIGVLTISDSEIEWETLLVLAKKTNSIRAIKGSFENGDINQLQESVPKDEVAFFQKDVSKGREFDEYFFGRGWIVTPLKSLQPPSPKTIVVGMDLKEVREMITTPYHKGFSSRDFFANEPREEPREEAEAYFLELEELNLRIGFNEFDKVIDIIMRSPTPNAKK